MWFMIACLSLLQTVITIINHSIRASRVVSHECKAVVQQYGQTIIDLLLAQVTSRFTHVNFCIRLQLIFIHLLQTSPVWLVVSFSIYFAPPSDWFLLYFFQQAQPKKTCSQIGLCTFNGAHGVRSGSEVFLCVCFYLITVLLFSLVYLKVEWFCIKAVK